MKEQTQLLHTLGADPQTGAISTPIYQTSTFVQQAPGVHFGYDYARSNNPTRAALEHLVATLEGGARASAFASGLAAIDAVVKLLQSGDEILAVDDIYGGAYRLFEQVYSRFGIKVNYVDTSNIQAVVDAVTPKTKLFWVESPTNPTLKVSDIQALAGVAHANNCLLVVDNTFCSPASQKPLALGADLVVHSGTKYLGGHSDLIAGLVVSKTPELGEQIKFLQNASGAILSPFDSWLTIRGIETLHLRVRQHTENAQKVALWLLGRPEVANVYYPGLEGHPNHVVAGRQQKHFGGVLSFDLKIDSKEAATKLVCSTRFFLLAESLGGVKSLLCLPCEMTHKTVPREKRYQSGVTDSLIRLSVGLEDADDLILDLQQAFEQVFSAERSNQLEPSLA